MIATRQAVATTLGRISVSSTVARSVCSFIARSSSGVTRCIRTRALWNVNLSSGRTRSRLRSSWGTSVSIVVLELGTIRPTRCNDFIVGQHPTRRRSQPKGIGGPAARALGRFHFVDPRAPSSLT
jgi:hypothetical protein